VLTPFQVQLKSASEPILDGELFEEIAVDESSWTVREFSWSSCACRTAEGDACQLARRLCGIVVVAPRLQLATTR
jgi:hypothetical protein